MKNGILSKRLYQNTLDSDEHFFQKVIEVNTKKSETYLCTNYEHTGKGIRKAILLAITSKTLGINLA